MAQSADGGVILSIISAPEDILVFVVATCKRTSNREKSVIAWEQSDTAEPARLWGPSFGHLKLHKDIRDSSSLTW